MTKGSQEWELFKTQHIQPKGTKYPINPYDAGFITGLLLILSHIRLNEKPTEQTKRISLEINTLIYDIAGSLKRIEDLCQAHSQSSETLSRILNSDTQPTDKQSSTSPSPAPKERTRKTTTPGKTNKPCS